MYLLTISLNESSKEPSNESTSLTILAGEDVWNGKIIYFNVNWLDWLCLLMKFDKKDLSSRDLKAIESMLSQSPNNPPQLDDVWQLMDNVWNEIGCDNKALDWGMINEFYSHPVWLLNGLFIEQHELSMQHRDAISDWIVNKRFKNVLDYGGGFGTLARLIARKDSNISVDIYEPYPGEYALLRAKDYSNIYFIDNIDKKYDCLVSTDVLEHVPDPLKLFSEMVGNVKMDGYLIIANNFYPVIKCHLPSTFHLRYTFRIFAHIMGLHIAGPCDGSHATIYQKKKDIAFNWRRIRKYEWISRMIFPFLDIAHRSYTRFKSVVR